MRLPSLLRHRDFSLYWSGVVLSEIGTRGTVAANLYHVYEISGSNLAVGFVGLFQAVALLVLSPLGGVYADRLDRKRLLQISQLISLVVSLGLAAATMAAVVEPWHIFVSVLLNTAAATFDRPARQALIPALVPRDELVRAFALINPSREVAVLVGPALAGFLIAAGGPGVMYAVDAASYAILVVALGLLKIPKLEIDVSDATLWARMAEGFQYVRSRRLIVQLMGLDLSATLFGAYRVLLPAIAIDLLGVGAAGYGLLGAAPSAGALLGSAVVFRLAGRAREGRVVLGSTIGYGLMAIGLVHSPALGLALLAAGGLGFFDALATTVRHAVVQLETPDAIRGRVTSIYQMGSRGGPALGDLNIGWLASWLGPVLALSLGGLVPVVSALALAMRAGGIRDHASSPVAEAASATPEQTRGRADE